MKQEAKALAGAWGFWLLCAVLTSDDGDGRDVLDVASLVIFALVTLSTLGTTARSLHRLATARRGRAKAPGAPAPDHGETAPGAS
ncbi:hypothetical protein [Streptomyces sp. NPDC001919]